MLAAGAVTALSNKRLKLAGGDRFKGSGVLCPWRGTDYRPLLLRRRASRPQLKRDPLGAPPMRVGLAILLALTLLGLPSAAAVGQRLANTFGPRYSPELVLPEQRVLFGRPALERPRECGARPILIAAGTLGGALGGYIGYQILWGKIGRASWR